MVAATSYASNQYGLEIRLWAHWIRSNPSDMCSSSLRGFTNCQRVTQAKVLKLKHMWCQRDSYISDPTIQPIEPIFLRSKTDHLLLWSQHLRNFRLTLTLTLLCLAPIQFQAYLALRFFTYTLCGKGCQIISDLASLF